MRVFKFLLCNSLMVRANHGPYKGRSARQGEKKVGSRNWGYDKWKLPRGAQKYCGKSIQRSSWGLALPSIRGERCGARLGPGLASGQWAPLRRSEMGARERQRSALRRSASPTNSPNATALRCRPSPSLHPTQAIHLLCCLLSCYLNPCPTRTRLPNRRCGR